MTLQKAPAAKELQDAGRAAPKVVQIPAPPSSIEQTAVEKMKAEQLFEIPVTFRRVEQKDRFVVPAFITEHMLDGSEVSELQIEPPVLFAEHFCGPAGPNTEHWELGSMFPTLQEDERPEADGGITVQRPPAAVAEQIVLEPVTVLQRLSLSFWAEQIWPGTVAEQVPPGTVTEQPVMGAGSGGITEVPMPRGVGGPEADGGRKA